MPYIKTFDRDQMMFCSWDSFVDSQSIARIIDAFINSLNMKDFNIKDVAYEGRPSYDPKGLFKLYLYGNRKGIRSSRKLAEACVVNIEVKWMLGGVEPDFRTISDFRKVNIGSMKDIFHEFNQRISGEVEWGFTSIDGSKFQACNSKDSNFTKNKLDDRIKWLDAHTEEYLRLLNEVDEQEDLDEETAQLTKDKINEKLSEAKERLARYEAYQKILEESGASQLSLTDADAKLMKSKNGFVVAYNPQTAVDSNTHLIRDFQMTNQVTDHGLLSSTMEGIRKDSDSVIEAVADKGYEDDDDMIKCLENGIIPNVIQDDGKDSVELEIDYRENGSDNSQTPYSRDLHAGKIPEEYKGCIKDMEIKEVRRFVPEETKEQSESIYKTPEEMLERAKEGYFVRDPERNLVYCPAGEILRQKCIKANGNIRYANKTACRHCPYRNRCYRGKNEWKEIDFTKDKLERPCKGWLSKAEPVEKKAVPRKGHWITKKVVRFHFHPDREKTSQRMCLSEHPFGTIKRAMGSTYFLLRGMKKVEGEFALFCLGYNLERARNLLGFTRLMKMVTR